LKNTLDGWKNFVDSEEYSEYHLIDICATLMTGREQFPYRYGCYVHNKDELTAFLFKDIPSFAKPDTHKWGLRVGKLLWENFADVQPLLEQEPLVKKYLNTVQQCLETLDISSEIKDGFQGAAWAPSLKPLYSFMLNYASLSALMAASSPNVRYPFHDADYAAC
jgi:hypothetical protein